MSGGKRLRADIDAKRSLKREKAEARIAGSNRFHALVPVNESLVQPRETVGLEGPEFLRRGCYVDETFTCRDCGATATWTATQQKWWYEVAKGSLRTRASRCGPCRRRKREADSRSRAGRKSKTVG